jgi:RNA polymerase sigma-70 factor (ECF subfamily)
MNYNESHNSTGQDTKDDYALIRAFHSGEKSAFDTLVMRHKDRVFNLCLRFLGDYQEAEDTAQDVFVKAYRSLKLFRFESSFFTWIYRITINTCKNKVNSLGFRYRKKDISIDIQEESVEVRQAESLENVRRDPVSELEKKEMMKTLQCAIDSLPSDQKSVVILRDIQGLSYEEITDITGFKLGTLKSRLSRARSNLREKLGGII